MKAFLVNQQMSFPLRPINLFFLVSSFLNTFVFATQHLCHPDQKDTLLEFKNEFGIQEPAWVNNTDCCSWDGITCDAGEVIGLDLSSSFLHGKLESNSSLFRLRHLRDLNLSNSSLTGQIPTKLLQLTKLVSLDLSSNSFSVDESFLPLLARNLKNLRELDMSSMNISSEIPHEFSNMQSLRLLHLSDCKLFGEFPNSVLLIPSLQSISLSQNPNLKGNLPDFRENNSLLELSISYTAFSGTIPDSISNLKHLTSLILTKSSFVGEIPSSIGNLKQLTTFYVGYNKLSGNLPAGIVNLTQLRSLFLSSNQFTGSLPPNISQLSKLESFYAEDNSFTGPILPSLLKIPSLSDVTLSCNHINDFVGFENISLLPNLQWFHVYHDNSKMVGPLDLNVFSPLKKLNTLSLNGIFISTANVTSGSDFLSNLEYLYLRGCNITEFPDFIRNQRNLHSLDLANNTIKGQVPDWLWRLPELVALDLSGNSLSSFNGTLKASPESQISRVDLSTNAFQGPLFIPSRSLQYFVVSKNNFTGEIPRSICGQNSLEVLDLSNNNLHDSIPRCLETLMSSLSDLNLSNNSLNGILPEIFMNATNLRTLDVSHNQIEGQLPASLTGCFALEVLNVGSNRINDMFPFQLNYLQKLQVLVLRSNKFHGTLHNADGVWFGFPKLKIIDVSHNDFFGILPSGYFLNWTMMSSNRDDNMGPEYITNPNIRGYYTSLVLMSKGVSMEMERILTIYTAIDFSGNQIHGYIPDSIGLLKELLILNISSNAFTGHIPSSLANLTNLESLDLSQNKISGEIPPELGTLSSLEWVNVSHNQLVGSIPQGTQFQRQKCSSYEGNPGLYGPSLKDVCGDKKLPTPPQPDPLDTEEEEEEEESSLNWIAAGIGFAPGVIFGLTIGYVVSSYKHYQNFWPKTFHKDVHEDFWSNHLTEYQNSLAYSSIKLPPSKHRCSVQI